jgi:hypothetical protein
VKSSVGELDESDARKAFQVQVWEAPVVGYAKRGEQEKAVLRVGKGGRGFVVETTDKKAIRSHGRALPAEDRWSRSPPAHPVRYLHECTYKKLLAPLGRQPAVIAECLRLLASAMTIRNMRTAGTPVVNGSALSRRYPLANVPCSPCGRGCCLRAARAAGSAASPTSRRCYGY